MGPSYGRTFPGQRGGFDLLLHMQRGGFRRTGLERPANLEEGADSGCEGGVQEIEVIGGGYDHIGEEVPFFGEGE